MTFSLKIHSEFEFLLKDMETSWVTFSLSKTKAWLITKFLIHRVIHNLFWTVLWCMNRIMDTKDSYFLNQWLPPGHKRNYFFLTHVQKWTRTSILLRDEQKLRQLKKFPVLQSRNFIWWHFSWISYGPVNLEWKDLPRQNWSSSLLFASVVHTVLMDQL